MIKYIKTKLKAFSKWLFDDGFENQINDQCKAVIDDLKFKLEEKSIPEHAANEELQEYFDAQYKTGIDNYSEEEMTAYIEPMRKVTNSKNLEELLSDEKVKQNIKFFSPAEQYVDKSKKVEIKLDEMKADNIKKKRKSKNSKKKS